MDPVQYPIQVSVLCAVSGEKFSMNVYSNDSVLMFKNRVLHELKAEGKFVRIICGGKMLSPDENTMASFKLKPGMVLHAVLSNSSPNHSNTIESNLLINANDDSFSEDDDSETESFDDEEYGFEEEEEEEDNDTEDEEENQRLISDHGEVTHSNRSHHSSRHSGVRRDTRGDRGKGFDRLLGSLSLEDIRSLRMFFQHDIQLHAENIMNAIEPGFANLRSGESRRRHRRRLEEAWILQGNGSQFGLNMIEGTGRRRNSDRFNRSDRGNAPTTVNTNDNNNGAIPPTNDAAIRFERQGLFSQADMGQPKDFAVGFIMGFFLGIIMLFWIWEAHGSYRQKMGIMSGVSCQLGLRYMKKTYDEKNMDDDNTPFITNKKEEDPHFDLTKTSPDASHAGDNKEYPIPDERKEEESIAHLPIEDEEDVNTKEDFINNHETIVSDLKKHKNRNKKKKKDHWKEQTTNKSPASQNDGRNEKDKNSNDLGETLDLFEDLTGDWSR